MASQHSQSSQLALEQFTQPLRTPGPQGLLGALNATQPVELQARITSAEIFTGKHTTFWAYQATQDQQSWLNPIFKVQRGQLFTANFTNQLPEATTIHWHGLHLDWHMDGHPRWAVEPGASFHYQFPVNNRGATYWYHPHAHHRTAWQTYHGLASCFIVEDEDTRRLAQSLDLTFGTTDLPLILQDRRFDESGQLLYPIDQESQDMGVEGDTILVNLTPRPVLEVSTRIYRLRILNGSNARIYRLALQRARDETLLPYWLIGTDGGLLEQPHVATEVFLSPGERVELLLDFSPFALNEEIFLISLPFDPMHNEMAMGSMEESHTMQHLGDEGHAMPHHHMGAPGLPGGQQFPLLRLVIKQQEKVLSAAPSQLSVIQPIPLQSATTRQIEISVASGGENQPMRWLINGHSYELDEYPIEVKKGTTEIWQIHNNEQSMPHPMHLHGFQFQVIDRSGSPEQIQRLAVDSMGRTSTDLGWKDTVLVWPGETVRIATQFAHPFPADQVYMFHCHILEHEDTGMMLNYRIS
ncbi:Bilirubin oxidase [Ktedonosporobacter rubrisoli]|uniref:Bilirubin oxidase n=1 Tax=Ktedonosporobacter rubrisoli TaxID=2509675 RepID=A0A4P6JVY2_KTERU|nr:multicopper oxidase domain-containing protein [Ktedonosporobacter rubrisoli]QBD79704.1 Bilirubin oxidase [Ktedonosporobacter rubrisoli]